MSKFFNAIGIAFLSLLIFFLVPHPFLFAEETITITTYYPSPYGSYNMLTTNVLITKRYAATTDIDWNNGNVQSLTLSAGANTLTFTNGQDGGKYILILKQPASEATVNWPASVIRWSGETAPTLTSGGSKTDYIGFIYNAVAGKYDGVATILDF